MISRSFFSFLVIAGLAAPFLAPQTVWGAESATDKVKNSVKDTGDDVSTGTKKAVRNTRQEARKATGTDSGWKDAKDSVHNTSDDLAKNARKTKRKLKSNP